MHAASRLDERGRRNNALLPAHRAPSVHGGDLGLRLAEGLEAALLRAAAVDTLHPQRCAVRHFEPQSLQPFECPAPEKSLAFAHLVGQFAAGLLRRRNLRQSEKF